MDNIAAIWARVSSSGQEELSPEGQVERVKTKLEGLGYVVPPEYIFKVVWSSLDLEACPEFQQLRLLIKGKKIQAVGFLDRDRIEAVGLQRLIFLSECRDNDVQPIIYQGVPVMSEPEGQLVELALAIGKERSVRRAQSGAKQGLADRARLRGLPPTKAEVYGMKWQDGMYRPDDNYENACLIFDLWFEKHNKGYIARELFMRGIPTSSGKRIWKTSSLNEILKNPVFAGRVATLKYERVEPKKRGKNTTFGKSSAHLKPQKDWHWLSGSCVEKPIITWEQHLEIERLNALNTVNSKRNSSHDDLGRGIIECMLCHRKYYGVQPSSGKRRKYVCSNHYAKPAYVEKCQAKWLDQKELDDGLKAKLRQFLEMPEVYLCEAKARIGLPEETRQDIEKSINGLNREYRQTIDNERRSAKILSEEAFIEEQKLLIVHRTWLSEDIERQNEKLANLDKYSLSVDNIEAMRERLKQNLDNAAFEDWVRIRDALGTKILSFGDGTWEIEVNMPATNESIANKTPWCTHPGLSECANLLV